MARILVIDDDEAIAATLCAVLSKDAHEVCAVCDPTRVPSMELSKFDLVICDVMMPALDGFELVRRIRPRIDCPIVFLTAKTEESDAVVGYGLGADDYIRKPFGVAELRAKVAAHLRRESRERHATLSFGPVRFDLAARAVTVKDTPVALTKSEYDICEHLARHPGQVFSRNQIIEAVFGWDSESDAATVSAHVSNARAKFKAAGAEPIATVWGVGYKWNL